MSCFTKLKNVIRSEHDVQSGLQTYGLARFPMRYSSRDYNLVWLTTEGLNYFVIYTSRDGDFKHFTLRTRCMFRGDGGSIICSP